MRNVKAYVSCQRTHKLSGEPAHKLVRGQDKLCANVLLVDMLATTQSSYVSSDSQHMLMVA